MKTGLVLRVGQGCILETKSRGGNQEWVGCPSTRGYVTPSSSWFQCTYSVSGTIKMPLLQDWIHTCAGGLNALPGTLHMAKALAGTRGQGAPAPRCGPPIMRRDKR